MAYPNLCRVWRKVPESAARTLFLPVTSEDLRSAESTCTESLCNAAALECPAPFLRSFVSNKQFLPLTRETTATVQCAYLDHWLFAVNMVLKSTETIRLIRDGGEAGVGGIWK